MNGKLTKTLGYTLLAIGLAVAAVPVSADYLSAERAQRLVFTPQNDANVAEISINEELIFRVDGLNLNAKFIHGVDISACSVSRINPGEMFLPQQKSRTPRTVLSALRLVRLPEEPSCT